MSSLLRKTLYITWMVWVPSKKKKTDGANGLWGGAILNRLFTNFLHFCSHYSSYLHLLIFQSSWILLSIHLQLLGEHQNSLVDLLISLFSPLLWLMFPLVVHLELNLYFCNWRVQMQKPLNAIWNFLLQWWFLANLYI